MMLPARLRERLIALKLHRRDKSHTSLANTGAKNADDMCIATKPGVTTMFNVTHTTGVTIPKVIWEDDIDSDPVRSSARTGHVVICTAISRWGVWSVRDSSGRL